MDINGLFDRSLKAALDCRAVWPPVLTPIQLGDYGVMVDDGFRRLGNVADFGLAFRTERGPPSRLDLTSADVRLTRFAGGAQVPAFQGLGDVSARVSIEFGRGEAFVCKCARVERTHIADLGGLARRLHDARTADGQAWRPLPWRLVWQLYTGHDVLFLAASNAGTRVELGGSARLLHQLDTASGTAGLSVQRGTGLGLEIVGDTGPIGFGLARVRLLGGVKFFSGEDGRDDEDEWVERLPTDADPGGDAVAADEP
jgi:hypothetical protein